MSRKLTKLTGEPKEQLQESKIKDNVVHVGLSQLLVLWKDYMQLRLVNWKSSQNKH